MPWLAICNYLTPDGVILIVVIPPITWLVVEIRGRYMNNCEDIVLYDEVKVADIMISTNKNIGNVDEGGRMRMRIMRMSDPVVGGRPPIGT